MISNSGKAHLTKRQRLAAMWRRKAPLWSVLSLFSIIGVFLIILPAVALFDQAGITRELSRDIGIAFVTASLLGVSVDIFLKRGIARDAFEGAVGYILPLEVKEAVHTLARMTWFAEEFSLVVNLNLVEDDLIKATIKIRKMVRNIGDIPQPITSYIQVDEWGRRYQSEVISCEIKTASGKVVATFNKDEVQVIGSSFKGETDEYMVGSGELVELLAEGR